MSVKYKITANTLSVREARAQFSAVLDRAHDFGESFVITNNGKPVAMVQPYNGVLIKKNRSRLKKAQQPIEMIPLSSDIRRMIGFATSDGMPRNKMEDKEIIIDYLIKKYLKNEHIS